MVGYSMDGTVHGWYLLGVGVVCPALTDTVAGAIVRGSVNFGDPGIVGWPIFQRLGPHSVGGFASQRSGGVDGPIACGGTVVVCPHVVLGDSPGGTDRCRLGMDGQNRGGFCIFVGIQRTTA